MTFALETEMKYEYFIHNEDLSQRGFSIYMGSTILVPNLKLNHRLGHKQEVTSLLVFIVVRSETGTQVVDETILLPRMYS